MFTAIVTLSFVYLGSGCKEDSSPSAAEPKPQSVVKSVTKSAAKSAAKSAVKSAVKSEAKTAAKSKPEPTLEPELGCPVSLQNSIAAGTKPSKLGKRVAIVDPQHNLQRFFRAWTELLTNPARKRKLRIAFYGDSNTQGDWAAAFLRKLLGKQLGLGGHGFVGAGKPNRWYEHRAIRTSQSSEWYTFSVSPHSAKTSTPHGHAGVVGVGRSPGATMQWKSAWGNESPLRSNEQFTHVRVHYLCQPKGGSFSIMVDGKQERQVDTRCATPAYSTVNVATKRAKHRVDLKTTTSPVAVFGASFENDDAGVVVDGLGINTGNYKFFLRANDAMFRAGLASREYDLVILATGVTMWAELDHFGLAKKLIGRIRQALGQDVSILVMPPGVWGDSKASKASKASKTSKASKPFLRSHIPRVVREKRELAQRNRTAYWDYFAAMGGKHALTKLIAAKQIYRDLLHFPPITHQKMMRRLSTALNHEFANYLQRVGYTCR